MSPVPPKPLSPRERELHDVILGAAWDACMRTCPPKYHPARPTNQTRLLEIMTLTRMLGYELLPHQLAIVATATEVADDGWVGGPLRIQEMLLSFGRQSGKSASLVALAADRLLLRSRSRVVWAAQLQRSALSQVKQEFVPRMIDHGFDESVGVKLVEGSHPELRCKETGGWILLRGTSGTAKGERGTFNDLLVVDELFSVDTFEPEASLTPTLSTRHKYGSASLMASTAPLEHSVFLAHKLDVHRGRANTSKSDMGFWEWAAAEPDDPADPAVWRKAIPGLAYGLISESFIASQFEKTPLDVFRREFLNIAAPSAGEDSFVSLDTWREVEQPPTSKLRATAPVWLGIDARQTLSLIHI